MVQILNLSECKEVLHIKEISPKKLKNYNYYVLHSGSLNKQILDYIVTQTKVSFGQIQKLFTFDFTKAEKGSVIIVINGIAMRR